jgi:hypothetical protein
METRLPYMIRFARNPVPLLFILIFYLASCDMFDLSNLDINSYPGSQKSVIGTDESVWLEFSTEMNKKETEAITSVKNSAGTVAFDTVWQGKRLIITPLAEWSPGVLYTLACEGKLKTKKGLSFTVYHVVDFYAGSADAPPVLIACTPIEDAIIERNVPIELVFSKSISSELIDQYITVSPSNEISIALSMDARTVTISPETEWMGLTRYQWQVSNALKDTDGIQILQQYSGHFRTQTDLIPPQEPTLSAVDIHDVSIPYPLTTLTNGMGLLFDFTEEINIDSFEEKLKFEPSFTPTLRDINGSSILVYPENKSWIPGETYTVTIETGLADVAGNLTTTEYEFAFTPANSVMEIVSISNTPALPVPVFYESDFDANVPLQIGVNAGTLEHSFAIRFSQEFTSREAESLLDSVSLEGYFPYDIGSPTLINATMSSPGDTITLQYDNFSLPDGSIGDECYYYKFVIKGENQGFVLEDGSMMSSDFSILLEAIAQ